MSDELLRQRLEALNRAVLPDADSMGLASRAAAAARRASGPAKQRQAASPLRVAPTAKLAPALAGLVARGRVTSNAAGEHLQIILPLDELWPGGDRLVRGRHQTLAATVKRALSEQDPREPRPTKGKTQKNLDDLRHLTQAFPDELLLLDLETCGLSGAALFLVGVLRALDEQLVVELLLARHYGEESAVLQSLWERIGPQTLLGTFNGKSFDWPMVQDRTARHLLFRGRTAPQPRHVDLLHAARRRWKSELPDCRLLTLEREICGRRRRDDIPGSQIPAAYAEFVRSGLTREMDAILMHNALDLVTLLDLAMRLASRET